LLLVESCGAFVVVVEVGLFCIGDRRGLCNFTLDGKGALGEAGEENDEEDQARASSRGDREDVQTLNLLEPLS
jgi:hypothetical protein